MAHAQAGLGFNPGNDANLEVQLFVLYSGVWSSNTSASQPSVTATNGPVEYSTSNVVSSTIYTPAITGRIGLQYRLPW
jgi:hypothetical protein